MSALLNSLATLTSPCLVFPDWDSHSEQRFLFSKPAFGLLNCPATNKTPANEPLALRVSFAEATTRCSERCMIAV